MTTTSKNQAAREQEMATTFEQVKDLMAQLQAKIDATTCPEDCTWGEITELQWIKSKLVELVS